jgi:hypothetical protein
MVNQRQRDEASVKFEQSPRSAANSAAVGAMSETPSSGAGVNAYLAPLMAGGSIRAHARWPDAVRRPSAPLSIECDTIEVIS